MTKNTNPQVIDLPASAIRPGPNDRQTFAADALADLAASIERDGLAQPPTVRPVDGGYELVCGERRFRAMTTVLHWTTVPCIVRDLDDAAAAAIMLAENVAREELDPIEEAHAYASRMDRFGLTVGEVAAMAGVTVARVTTRLPLLALCAEAVALVRTGGIGINHARAMERLDGDRQRVALRSFHRHNLDLFSFHELCQRLLDAQVADASDDLFGTAADRQAQSIKARRAVRSPKNMKVLIKALADALEAAGGDDALIREAREAVSS